MRVFGNRLQGLTLIELLVTLAILSILAMAAMPFAEITVKRNKEQELHRALRRVRTAIDRFHEDWLGGRIAKSNDNASSDGYPKNLQVLIDGVEKADAKGGKIYYLRRIPHDPFASSDEPLEEQWEIRSYQDDRDTVVSSGNDVYDIHSKSERTALDGTSYKDW